ncbi:hypothetical protein [Streptomyces sp. NPDC047108]|uniref:hypothetical protein n=1 Tax=Streptomyces sp. NPDC047108 TaxID=3155025 RepID=UPI0033FFA3A9
MSDTPSSIPGPDRPLDEELAAYLGRLRQRLPSMTNHLGGIATTAVAADETVSPQRFQEDFSRVIRSLSYLGVSLDRLSKELSTTTVRGQDGRSMVEVECSARMEGIKVRFLPTPTPVSTRELEAATARAFEDVLRACRDLSIRRVEETAQNESDRFG